MSESNSTLHFAFFCPPFLIYTHEPHVTFCPIFVHPFRVMHPERLLTFRAFFCREGVRFEPHIVFRVVSVRPNPKIKPNNQPLEPHSEHPKLPKHTKNQAAADTGFKGEGVRFGGGVVTPRSPNPTLVWGVGGSYPGGDRLQPISTSAIFWKLKFGTTKCSAFEGWAHRVDPNLEKVGPRRVEPPKFHAFFLPSWTNCCWHPSVFCPVFLQWDF